MESFCERDVFSALFSEGSSRILSTWRTLNILYTLTEGLPEIYHQAQVRDEYEQAKMGNVFMVEQ